MAGRSGVRGGAPPSEMVIYQVPACPFSQRLEILLELKGARRSVDLHFIDITRPLPDWLLSMTGGAASLPVLSIARGQVIRESLVIMDYLDGCLPGRTVAHPDPYRRAVEQMLTRMEGPLAACGYGWILNQDRDKSWQFRERMVRHYGALNTFLETHATGEDFLWEDFGWAETVYAPLFVRFCFLEYYEQFALPATPEFTRVRRWIDACIRHAAAQQVSREEVIKTHYDYAKGASNGALVPGRRVSTFALLPGWRERPWPPGDKYGPGASDEELGLLAPEADPAALCRP